MQPLTPLYATRQWILVELVPLPTGKTDKLPIDYRTGNVTPGGSGGAFNPDIWLDHASAAALAAHWGPRYTVGFVITPADPFWCLDIDGARTPTGWSDLALKLIASLPGTVVEVSQSGTGLHVWGQGPVPPHSMKRVDLGIELYSERRFIAIGSHATGDMSQSCATIAAVAAEYFPPRAAGASDVPDTGPCADWRGPADDADLIRRAMQSRSAGSVFGARASFADLWTADAAALGRAYPPSDAASGAYDASSADAALAQHLAFWTGRDVARIERLMRQSALVRSKWDDRDDYLVARTIMGACARQVQVLQDRPVEKLPEVAGPAAVAPTYPCMTPVTGQTFLGPEQQAEVLKGCVYVLEQHRALVPGGLLLNPDRFRARFGGYTWAMDARNERTTRNAWEAFTESQILRPPIVNGTCFRPDLPYGAIVADAGRTRANTWWPIETPRKAGDPGPFLRHVRALVPDERDAQILLSWMACAVQYPGRKFQCAVFMQGCEGNGKSFFSRCLNEVLGKRYVHWPDPRTLGERFNAWLYGKLLICVEDIHVGSGEDQSILERMKPWITGTDGVEIEGKGVDQLTSEICANFFLNSNYKNGVRKHQGDRRYITFITPQQDVSDLGRDGLTPEHFKGLYDWARADGWAIIHEYLATYPIPDEFRFDRGLRAPQTSTTELAIEAGRGRVEQEILEAVAQGLPGFKGGWISSIAVDRLLDRIGRSSVGRSQRRELLRSLGYVRHPALPDGRATTVVGVDGGKPRLYVRAGHPAIGITQGGEAVAAYSAAQLATA